MKAASKKPPVKFGAVLGLAPGGVPIYSSDYDSADEREFPTRQSYQSHLDGIRMGYKWQCVEFARRWLYVTQGYIFEDVPMAYDIFKLRFAQRISDGAALPLHAFANGSKRLPQTGCMLIWNEGGEFVNTGHVAIVTEVTADHIRVVEQNVTHQTWNEEQHFSRQIKATLTEDGEYWIQCTYGDATILGWVIQTDDDRHAEQEEDFDNRLLAMQLRAVEPDANRKKSWLNVANEDEAAYVEMMGGHKLSSVDADQYRYYALSKSAQRELRQASNELHAKFMFATEHVLKHDAILATFNLPRAVWPRIRNSWNNRRNQMITGRFDFAVSERGIKAYEYNADSASCYMECGKVQGRWAEHYECDEGSDPGEFLFQSLVKAWKNSDVDDVLHIMQDKDKEESYHALFMKSALENAGIECRIIRGLSGLSWDENGNILDQEGLQIKWVWKTWAWETALDQIRLECEEDESKLRDYRFDDRRNTPPRLVDVLLRDGVMVYEPLWTLIPSNKAILPVLSSLFPDNDYLLETGFTLTDELVKSGYAVKPIAGRCGHNISIIDKNSDTIDATSGQFTDQDQVYQELWPLPLIEDYYVQISTFTVAGWYAGSCARVDRSPVITKDSDVMPMRILDDSDFE